MYQGVACGYQTYCSVGATQRKALRFGWLARRGGCVCGGLPAAAALSTCVVALPHALRQHRRRQLHSLPAQRASGTIVYLGICFMHDIRAPGLI